MAASRVGPLTVGALAGGVAASASGDSGGFAKFIREGAQAALRFLAQPVGDVTPVVMAKSDDSAALALAASARAIESMIKQQSLMTRSGGISLRTLLWLAVPASAAALAYHYLGWANFGWATPVALQTGLRGVRDLISSTAAELRELSKAGFARLDKLINTTRDELKQTKEEIKGEVRAVGDSVENQNARLDRATQGIELLCEVVHNVGLTNNASNVLRQRLEDYNGTKLAPQPKPSLTHSGSSLANSGSSLTTSSSSFMSAILMDVPRQEIASQ